MSTMGCRRRDSRADYSSTPCSGTDIPTNKWPVLRVAIPMMLGEFPSTALRVDFLAYRIRTLSVVV